MTDIIKLTNLTCEYMGNPLGIDFLSPRLSWQITGDASNVKQIAYQIIASEKEEDIINGNAVLWDSGKIESDQSHLINYSGPELKSGQRIYWAVKIWDNSGGATDFSEPAFFEMGLLDEKDWDDAEWIGRLTDINDKENEKAPMLRKEFSVKKEIASARAYISGLGFYELLINGKRVGERLLDPGVTRYDKRVLYVVHDITKYLNEDENAVGVILGNGFYNQFCTNVWDAGKAPWRNCPSLLMKILVNYTDGTKEIIISDTSWKVSTGPIIFNGMYMGEVYDARFEKKDWSTTEYNDDEWQQAVTAISPKGKICCHILPPVKITETFSAKSITEPKPGLFVADMGVNFAGWVKINVKGPAGTKIILKYGERLREDGTVERDSLRVHLEDPKKFQTDTYILKGDGEETFEPKFNYHGFQYVQIEDWPGKPELSDIKGCFLHTAFEQTGTFKCSNDLFNKIQECTLRSYRSNFHHFPTDCPHREKNGWMADAHLSAELGYRNFNPASAYAKWMDDIKDEQRDDGALPGIVPTAGWGYDWGNGPAWDSAYTLICWYQYLNCGDKKILEDHFDTMAKYVDYAKTKAGGYESDGFGVTGGIVCFGLGDWLPPSGFPDDSLVPDRFLLSAYYYKVTELVSEIAKIIGRTEAAEKYEKEAQSIKDNINRAFHIPSLGIYTNGTMAAQSTALYQDVVPEGNIDLAVEKLVSDVERLDYHPICGAHTVKWILHVLSDNGHADIAYKIANQKTYPSWGYWMDKGATTLFESWQAAGSLNHIFFGDISHWFYKCLAGIQIDTQNPGYKNFIIKPSPVEDLTWVDAEQQTPYGKIKSEWKVEKNVFTINVSVPHNSTATVILPDGSKTDITSGDHTFKCKI